MANTLITLTPSEGVLVPSQPSVPVSSGDTISFSTADGSVAYLFFSPDAAEALSPSPSNPLEVSAGSTELTFTASTPGAYSVFFETSPAAAVPPFPAASSMQLVLAIDPTGVCFTGQDNNTRR